MQEDHPLFHELQIQTVITWTRWWHLTARALVLVFKKKIWGVVGNYLKREKERVDPHIILLRTSWSRRGRELGTIKHSA